MSRSSPIWLLLHPEPLCYKLRGDPVPPPDWGALLKTFSSQWCIDQMMFIGLQLYTCAPHWTKILAELGWGLPNVEGCCVGVKMGALRLTCDDRTQLLFVSPLCFKDFLFKKCCARSEPKVSHRFLATSYWLSWCRSWFGVHTGLIRSSYGDSKY